MAPSETSTNMIVNCNGTENNLKSCFSQTIPATPCSHLLVECHDPTTMPTTAPTTAEDEDDGASIPSAVIAGVCMVVVVMIIL